jgi:hypothetical protein
MARFRSKDNGNLTEADKKFYALRESGYTGPIDQNGDKAESGRAADILKSLRNRT